MPPIAGAAATTSAYERAHVVGHSYGGDVALQLALDAPEVVHTLAVLEPALMLGASGSGYRASLATAAERYRVDGADATIDAALEARWPGYRPVLDRLLPGAFAQAVADAPFEFDHNTPGMLAWTFGEAEARRISPPTLSVLGGNSPSCSPPVRGGAQAAAGVGAGRRGSRGAVGVTHRCRSRIRAAPPRRAVFWARHPLSTGPSARSTPGSGRNP